MTWYERAAAWIEKEMMSNPSLSLPEMKKHCSKNYPFGERKYFPYKAFLRAMRDVFGDKRKQVNARRCNQQDMFETMNEGIE